MASQSTQFNPFGERQTEIRDLRSRIQKMAEKFEEEAKEGGKISPETRSIAQVFERLGQISKEIDESAVQSLLSELSTPLAHFLRTLCKKAEKLVKPDVGFLNRCTAKLIAAIAERITGSFTSDHLEQWAGILEPLVSGKGLKDSGIALWKATFATVKGKLRYPANLRDTLKKMSTRKLYLPPDETSAISRTPSFDEEEEAMDGMFPTTSEAAIPAPESQGFSQILSQQAEVDDLAEKLLKEQKRQQEAQKTPTIRRRASRMPSLLDEDSCDFVTITTTPTSSKKAKLTDRQKQKLAEAAGPRTTINYVDEESQSCSAKTEQMKAALLRMNYDVGEESVCAPAVPTNPSETVETAETLPKPATEPIEPIEPTKPIIQEDEPMDTSEKPDTPPATTTRTTRARKSLFESKETSGIQKKASENVEEEEKTGGELEKLPRMTDTVTPRRNGGGRVKKTPKQCLPDRTPPAKKRLRSSTKKEESDEDIPEVKAPEAKMSKIVEDSEDVVKDSEAPEVTPEAPAPEDQTLEVAAAPESKISEDDVKAPEVEAIEASEVTVASESRMPSESHEAPEVPENKDSDGSQEVSSPKTPRTPSILRTRKDGILTPLTKNRNRVHFPVDCVPDPKPRSNPSTPKRQKSMDIAEKKPSESPHVTTALPSSSESSSSSDSLADLLEDPFSSSSSSLPFYKGLVGCNDPIERIVRKLAPMNTKIACDCTRRSLSAANIKTVGEFASLTKKQINEMAGVKNPKERSARSVLADYESEKLREARRCEEKTSPETPEPIQKVKLEDADKSDKDESDDQKKDEQDPVITDATDITEKTDITDNTDIIRTPSPPLQPLPMLITYQKDSDSEAQDSQDSESSQDSVISDNNENDKTIDKKSVSDKTPEEVIRKNLAPIFEKNRVKSEPQSPAKLQNPAQIDNDQQQIIKDFQDLHNVISRLSMAHILNQAPAEVWTAHMDVITKSAILFQSIVQKHGIALGDWDDTEWAGSEDVRAPESDLKALRSISRRISRSEACGRVGVETWKHVMYTVSEAATLLEEVVKQRGAQKA